MIKNRLTKAARKERKKRRYKAQASEHTMEAYSKMLAEFPARRLKLVKQQKQIREQKVFARRQPVQPAKEGFLIGGERK